MTVGRTLARGGLIVAGAFLASRLLGWFRLVVFTWSFDAATLAPFIRAFAIPDLLFQLVAAGALSSALIPTIAQLRERGEEARAWRVVSTIANLMLLALAVLAGLLLVFADLLVPTLIAPGLSAAQQAETVLLTRIMLLSPILLALGSVATSVLNARDRFAASALAPIAYNLGIVLGGLLLAEPLGLVSLAVGVVAGSACHLSIQLRPLFRGVGFRYSPRVALDDPEVTRTLLLLAPRALGLGGAQIQLQAAGTIATALGPAIPLAFTYAFTIFQIPIGVIGVPLGIVALPTLAQQVAAGAMDEYASLVRRSLRLMAFVMVPIAVLGAVAATPVTTLLFGHGKVTPADVERIAAILAVFFVALASETWIALLARAFYALRDTRTPVGAALLAVAVSITVTVVTAPLLGPPALALGIAVASWVEALVLLVLLRRRVEAIAVGSLAPALAANLACAALAALVLRAALDLGTRLAGPDPGTIEAAAVLAAGGAAGGLAYLAGARLLRIPEGPTILRLVRTARTRGAAG